MAVDNLSDLGSSISTTQADTGRIYCVVLKDLENLSELQERQLNKAHELLKQHNAKVAVASAKNVMKNTTKVAGLSYIIPELDGELYEHLVEHNARIYGPLAIIQSLTKTGKIPKSPKPLLAMYCSNFIVTVTGLDLEERKNVFDKIDALGGVSSGIMSKETTHLFANMCDPKSEKYQRAVRDRIMIVSPAWVDFAYEAAKHGTLSNSIPLADHMIKVFTGCVMTASGFNGDQRLKISELVRQNGGEFSGSMAQQTCTHLVIDSNTGEKYRKAVEWKTVKIVTLKWLIKCAESGIKYDEDDYEPAVSDQTVPNKILSGPDVSAVFSKTRNPTPPSSTASSSNASIVAGDHIMMNDRQRNATATATDNPVMDSDMSLYEESINNQQQKITKVKPQRRRLFGMSEESEEGTDIDRSRMILAGVRRKHNRKPPAPSSNDSIVELEEESDKEELDEESEEIQQPPPQSSASCTTHSSRSSNDSDCDVSRDDSEPDLEPSKFYDVFFTNVDPKEKLFLEEQVRAIQGTYFEAEMSKADVIVCNKLQISEKLMAALAAGKFIVPATYIIESNRKGYWLPLINIEGQFMHGFSICLFG
uniref:BRCT domain-containing protein n=1 Tax=Panagrolaimus davidi TaxID=227884 RepID=A0A914PIE4_9BILA